MVKDIVKDIEFLKEKSEWSVIREDKQVYSDLLDTAKSWGIEKCLGLAAVQVGYHKRVIAVWTGKDYSIFVNPIIYDSSKEVYEAEEGCLSLEGMRKTIRHSKIGLLYTTLNGKTKRQVFSGLLAQIIQHEVDHCNGILI